MKPDITTREDIARIVDAFYEKVKADALLGHIFTDIVKVDWSHHLPKMYGFWENVLFQTGSYRGQPFLPHLDINAKETLTPDHFGRWLKLFHATIDELYEGTKARELKFKSQNIKEVWNYKMDYINHYDETHPSS
ncbi:MAG: group III truncated hemoglobin [Bacteroidetes bacterium]|nr:group III truncated hemoglobin [Bacteroidota bacterium]